MSKCPLSKTKIKKKNFEKHFLNIYFLLNNVVLVFFLGGGSVNSAIFLACTLIYSVSYQSFSFHLWLVILCFHSLQEKAFSWQNELHDIVKIFFSLEAMCLFSGKIASTFIRKTPTNLFTFVVLEALNL